MSFSRRQFFRRLVRPGEKTPQERRERYETMDAYVRTSLLPYDFSLTEEQEAELFAAVRADLEQTSDEELFSSILRFKVEEVADRKIRYWRDQNYLNEQLARVKEIRTAAPTYVAAFLHGQATAAAIDEFKARFELDDMKDLENVLTGRVQDWIQTVEEAELLQYNVVSVKDFVFNKLRSWCSE
jgi:hypothetical protein